MEMQSCGNDLEADECRRFHDDLSELNSKLFLDGVGMVFFSVNSAGVSWKLEDSNNESSCLGKKIGPISAAEIKFSEIYAAELDDFGLNQQYVPPVTGWCLLKRHGAEMHRFKIHGVNKLKTHWVSVVYTFGHTDLNVCRTFVNQINGYLKKELGRPKSLMVFVHPLSGRRKGQRTWEGVAPIFTSANIRTKVIVTERAGHAFDVMASMGNQELDSYDGVVAVGGDGFFNEILNGYLLSRLKAPFPPIPPDFVDSHDTERFNHNHNLNEKGTITSEHEDQSPLLSTLDCDGPESPFSKAHYTSGSPGAAGGAKVSFPNNKFRFGLIPAGSTDAIVMCTTGARDPITSALQIVLGKRVSLDIAQVIKWKTTYESKEEPSVRYTASFVGYGFYGDVIKESEKYRWMGPSRYDVAGTKVFLKRKSYEAEVAYLEVKSSEETSESKEEDHVVGKEEVKNSKKSKGIICRANCKVCSDVNEGVTNSGQLKWVNSRGRFLSVGSAVITCRNEKAPDGLVADAHLSDGFLHLILIKECPRPLYLRHLIELTKKGGSPLDFKFIEHHKTLAFGFTSFGEQSIWNLDGELLQAHKLSVQVFRGLITLFATGPEL